MPGYSTSTSLWNQNLTIEDNLIQSVGRIHPDAAAIVVSESPHNLIDHNTIQDTYFTPIELDGTPDYGASLEWSEIVSDNRIDDVGQGVLSDLGGVYVSGLSPDTFIRGNVISNVTADPLGYGGWGVYLDEGASDITIERNLVYNCSTSGFFQNFGANNLITNNIFANGAVCDIERNLAEDHLSFTFTHNIVYGKSVNEFRGAWSDKKFVLNYNDYWDPDGTPFFNGLKFAAWQATGSDTHSIYADPLFVDAATFNFALKGGSPSSKVGFTPFSLTGVGINWVSKEPLGLQTMPSNTSAPNTKIRKP